MTKAQALAVVLRACIASLGPFEDEEYVPAKEHQPQEVREPKKTRVAKAGRRKRGRPAKAKRANNKPPGEFLQEALGFDPDNPFDVEHAFGLKGGGRKVSPPPPEPDVVPLKDVLNTYSPDRENDERGEQESQAWMGVG